MLITASFKQFFSIHHYRIEQIKFEYLLFSFLQAFQKKNPRIYKTSPQQCFNVSNSLGLTYLNKLHLDLSPLREHKFCQVFRDSLNPIFNCSNSIESTKHYLCWQNFNNEKQFVLHNITIVIVNLLSMAENALTHLLLYGNILTDNTNTVILNSSKVVPLGNS